MSASLKIVTIRPRFGLYAIFRRWKKRWHAHHPAHPMKEAA